MKKLKLTDLLIFIVGAELTGALSGLLAGNSFSFYKELIRPPLSPPGWLFPVVWTILYALMGISAFLVYTSDSKKKAAGLIIYTLQMFINFMWSIVFFRFKMPELSAVLLLILIILIITMTTVFYKIRPLAAFLNIPYLLWTAFALYLNIGILLLN